MSQSLDSDDEDYDDYDSYYQEDCYEMDTDQTGDDDSIIDPEYFDFKAFNTEDVERLLNESVAKLQSSLQITPSLAKVLLHRHSWSVHDILCRYKSNPEKLLVESRLKQFHTSQDETTCEVCFCSSSSSMLAACCSHVYCRDCWSAHIDIKIQQGCCTDIMCMAEGCNVILTEDTVLDLITKRETREKHHRFAFEDHVNRHPCLRFCPGPGCSSIIYAKEKRARKVSCVLCSAAFCFGCGRDYHAPTGCDTIQKWLTKCLDDSETANYISVHTKDCPSCHVCIEKNGGCNHIQCYKCKHDFCWVCEGDWKDHAGQYYVCSKYTEADSSIRAKNQAREALVKYLHYFTRWDNHSKSLKLEAQETAKIKSKIEQKVLEQEGTWIDWQYLLDATELLRRCRYTLQYTYPYAYYQASDSRKQLFEYQQGRLEAEVENLSWKVQKAEITDRGDLENQMNVAEKMRLTLLNDFLSL